jgi:tetratricopeptide (TPR) repeat protein
MRVLLAILLGSVAAVGATTNEPTDDEAAWTLLQQQQQATQRAIEESRVRAETLALRQQVEMDNRLRQLERLLQEQRARELTALQESHRFALIVIGTVAAIGLAGLLTVVVLVLRRVGRRPAAVTVQPLGGPAFAQLPEAADAAAPLAPAPAATTRLRSSLQRLEARLTDLESATAAAPLAPAQERAGRVALLLGKGQTLLNLQQTDTALTCFDEALALDPDNPEAFVKKAAALEKLGRWEEAVACYDRAIALDSSMTMAYLGKGGVFNRLERYGEALQCYEQALRAQQQAGG